MNLRNLILSSIVSLTALFSTTGAAKPLGVSMIDTWSGLTSSTVKAIVQDDMGLMWIGTKNGLNRYDGVSVKTYNVFDHKANRGNNNVSALYQDKQGKLWVGTDRGIYLFNPVAETFTIIDYKSADGVSPDDWIYNITADHDGNIWTLVPNQGAFRIYDGDKIDYYPITQHKGNKELIPLSLQSTPDGKIYVGTARDGLFVYEKSANNFRKVGAGHPEFEPLDGAPISVMVNSGGNNLIVLQQAGNVFLVSTADESIQRLHIPFEHAIFVREAEVVDNELWIGTNEGLYLYDLTTNTLSLIDDSERYSNRISDNVITAIVADSDKNMWVGTMYGGLNHLRRQGLVFETFSRNERKSGLSSDRIRGMCTDNNGKIWIGTEENGLNLLDPATNLITHPVPFDQTHRVCLSLRNVDGKIHAGFHQGGLNVIDNDRVTVNLGNDLISKGTTSVYSMERDSKGNVWVAADWGVFLKRTGSDNFVPVKEMEMDWVNKIMEDSKGVIWFASMGNGVWTYNTNTNRFTHYPYDENHSNGLRSNTVNSVMEDSNGHIWLSTERGGLARYNPASDNFTSFGIAEGLPDEMVYDILEDQRGFLWFGTGRGLVKFNPVTGGVKVFNERNGLGVTQFNYAGATKGKDGKFYMGGINGLVAFNPMLDSNRDSLPAIYLTRFRVGNDETMVRTSDNDNPINVLYAEDIIIPNGVTNFSLGIATPTYDTPNTMIYSYRLLPKDKEWTTVADPANLTFIGVAPGSYTLEIRAQSDNAETVKQIPLRILPPWYLTTWAMVLFILIVLGVLACVLYLYRRRQQEKMAEKEKIFTMTKERELYKSKMNFFTEIAHEIRTPLTLIGTPLEAIEEIGIDDKRVKRYMEVIRQNTNRLMDLSTQLLDFQKLESERPELKFETVNITELVKGVAERFELTMTLKNKSLSIDIPSQPIYAHIDREAITKIISNLFNNALKYSLSKIAISLSADDKNFRLQVVSDGNKIKGEDVFKIFMPFYQVDKNNDNKGVGIGLPLTRTLASMHGGSIELENIEGPDNTFVLTIPLVREGLEVSETDLNPTMAEYVMEDETALTANPEGYSLLFVDDNEEMRNFLSEQLSKSFVVETAADGKEALEKLDGGKFDIIVTDIMMPEMDGYELCRTIKENPDLSHIPVVFLTAKNDLESKVKALKIGGESYIEKPFSIKYFRQQVMALLDNRRHERKAFLNKPFFTVDNMKLNPGDEEFMNQVVDLIKKNISDENFSVEAMADTLCMSRSSLLRKIKTIYNLSPVELIRLVRLKKAAELIQEGKYRISDVCYMVGINSSSYFSKLFYKQFGLTPKAFEKQCQKNTHIILTTSSNPTSSRKDDAEENSDEE